MSFGDGYLVRICHCLQHIKQPGKIKCISHTVSINNGVVSMKEDLLVGILSCLPLTGENASPWIGVADWSFLLGPLGPYLETCLTNRS